LKKIGNFSKSPAVVNYRWAACQKEKKIRKLNQMETS